MGTALPSVATCLIENLPDEIDPRWPEELRIAQDTAAVAYIGMGYFKYLSGFQVHR